MAMHDQFLTLKSLSFLLTYPEEDLVATAPAIPDVLALEDLVGVAARDALAPLLEALAQDDLYVLQETYVSLFDRTRRLSLHLFEHVHGESRDRGQAMVDLSALYEAGGLHLMTSELPDFLPLFVEYAATRPLAEAKALLADVDHILAALEERLVERGSTYAAVFCALRNFSGAVATSSPAAPAWPDPANGSADDLAALDKEWEETLVTFGPGDAMGGCSVDRFRTQLRAAQRDARHDP